MTASATVALASRLGADPQKIVSKRALHELRAYYLKADTRLSADGDPALLDPYLEKAMVDRKLDFQRDRIREGCTGRVTGGNMIGPLC